MATNAPGKTAPDLDRAFDLFEAGNLVEAAEACKFILASDDHNYGALYLLGGIYGEQGKFRDAASLLARAVEINPTKPVAYYNLANVLDQCNRPREALTAINSYIARVQDNADAHILRAVICSKLQRFEDSARSGERAVALKPESGLGP